MHYSKCSPQIPTLINWQLHELILPVMVCLRGWFWLVSLASWVSIALDYVSWLILIFQLQLVGILSDLNNLQPTETPSALVDYDELKDDDDGVDDSHVIESCVELSKKFCKYSSCLYASSLYRLQAVRRVYPDQVGKHNFIRLIQEFIYEQQHPSSSAHNIPDLPHSMKPSLFILQLLPLFMPLATSLELGVWSASIFMLLVAGGKALAITIHCSLIPLPTM